MSNKKEMPNFWVWLETQNTIKWNNMANWAQADYINKYKNEAIELASRPDNPPTIEEQEDALRGNVETDHDGTVDYQQTVKYLNADGYYVIKIKSNE